MTKHINPRDLVEAIKLTSDGFTASTKRSDFFIRKLRWHDALSERLGKDYFALAVAMAIGRHLNSRTGTTYVSREKIADGCNACVRSVDRAISRLERLGLLAVQRTRGRRSNVYGVAFPTEQATMLNGDTTVAVDGLNGDSPVPPDRSNSDSTVALTLEDKDSNLDSETLSRFALASESLTDHDRPKVTKADPDEPSSEGMMSDAAIEAAFEDSFWPAYPKQEGKWPALKAFKKAVRSGVATADQIIHGAFQLADHWAGANPDQYRYIATAEKWLRDRRWSDELGGRRESITMLDLAVQFERRAREVAA